MRQPPFHLDLAQVGHRSTVGAAAVVTRSIPTGGTVIGVNHLLKRREPAGAEAGDVTDAGARPVASTVPKRALGFVAEAVQERYNEKMRARAEEESAGGENTQQKVTGLKRVDSHTWFYHREHSESVEEGSYDMFGV